MISAQEEWQELGTGTWLRGADAGFGRGYGLAHTGKHMAKGENWQYTEIPNLKRSENTELPVQLLNYFLWSDKCNINQSWRPQETAPSESDNYAFIHMLLNITYYVTIRAASEYPFCVLIKVNPYIFHFFSFYWFICQTQIWQLIFCMLDVIVGRHTWILLLLPHGKREAE